MNKYRKTALLYFLSAACFLTAGIIGVLQDRNMPYMFIGLGCAFICLGCANLAKAKKEANEQDEEEK